MLSRLCDECSVAWSVDWTGRCYLLLTADLDWPLQPVNNQQGEVVVYLGGNHLMWAILPDMVIRNVQFLFLWKNHGLLIKSGQSAPRKSWSNQIISNYLRCYDNGYARASCYMLWILYLLLHGKLLAPEQQKGLLWSSQLFQKAVKYLILLRKFSIPLDLRCMGLKEILPIFTRSI